MSAPALLAELEAAGIRLTRDDGDIIATMRPGASLDRYRERIMVHKPSLLAELLKAAILAALDVAPADFDRPAYERLTAQWHALEAAGAFDAA